MEEPMKHGILIAGIAALATGVPALADAPLSLHGAGSTTEIAQAQAPVYPPTPPSTVVPIAPPAPQAEFPPPAPSPRYVWEPGHWSWNGVQYFWDPGKYVERPMVSATHVPGHWEQRPSGWVWVDSRWEYPGVGSSTPPTR
jgi:hypothetical protein